MTHRTQAYYYDYAFTVTKTADENQPKGEAPNVEGQESCRCKVYITKEEKYQININQKKSKLNQMQKKEEKIIKIQAEINQTENFKSNRKNQLNQEFVFQ